MRLLKENIEEVLGEGWTLGDVDLWDPQPAPDLGLLTVLVPPATGPSSPASHAGFTVIVFPSASCLAPYNSSHRLPEF